jgi:archaellum biogenesis ATPase FlaH
MNSKNKEFHTRKNHCLVEWETIEPKEVTYLWENRIPFGKITVVSGDAGKGKTTLILDIAARLTTGSPMPFSVAEPIIGNVLFQSQEDKLDDTLVPRCINAGVDIKRIASIKADGLNIDDDCDIIEHYIQMKKARLLVLDPLQSWCGSIDMCRITDIRRILSKLGEVAANNDCAIVIIAHQNKAQGGNDLHRVFGSVDITAVARSVLQVSDSETDPDTRVVTHIKSSLSRPDSPFSFRIEDKAPIKYLYVYDGDLDGIMPDDFDKREKAIEIIQAMLSESPRIGTEVYAACKAVGIGSRTVEKAKKDLNICSGRDENNNRVWVLP